MGVGVRRGFMTKAFKCAGGKFMHRHGSVVSRDTAGYETGCLESLCASVVRPGCACVGAQDAGLRAAADERRQEKRLRAEFEAEAAAAERQRQWRIARGEATAADLAGPVAAQFGGPSRDSWMTELPPERKAGSAMPSMVGAVRHAQVQGFCASWEPAASLWLALGNKGTSASLHTLGQLSALTACTFTLSPSPPLPSSSCRRAKLGSARLGSRNVGTPLAGL